MLDNNNIQRHPTNEKGQYHGYHDVVWSIIGGWYKAYFINGNQHGWFQARWNENSKIEKVYYAR